MTALLLLHPLGSDGSFWSSVAGLLGRPTLAPDLCGHGRAAPPTEPTMGAFGDAVLAGLEEEGQRDVVAVGISLGGLVAQDLAARPGSPVRGLVLVDTVARYPDPFRSTWPERAATARTAGLEPLADAMAEMWFSPHFRERHPGVVAATRRTFVGTDPEGYARTCEALYGADTTAALAATDVPTLVMCGDADAPPFLAAAPLLAEATGGELVWLEGAQHASVIEQPERFAATVTAFLDRHGL